MTTCHCKDIVKDEMSQQSWKSLTKRITQLLFAQVDVHTPRVEYCYIIIPKNKCRADTIVATFQYQRFLLLCSIYIMTADESQNS